MWAPARFRSRSPAADRIGMETSVVGFSPGFPGPFSFIFSLVAALVLIAAWVILAASRFTQGGIVERPERIPQLYGYTVCLIALVWAITSFLSLVGNALTLSAPELRGSMEFGWEPSVSSFEAFRTTYDRSRLIGASDAREAHLDTLPEPELRRRYEALRADRVQRVRFEARREMIMSLISLVIAIPLFVFHWRRLRRLGGGLSSMPVGDVARPPV